MKFNFLFACRQMRGEFRKSTLILFCVALGVSSRVAIGSFLGGVSRALLKEARGLLSADLEVSSRTPFDPLTRAQLKSALPEGSEIQEMMSFVTMAVSQKGGSRLVEVRAVESGYPFFGVLEAVGRDGSVESKIAQGRSSVYVQKELLSQLSLSPGDALKIGRMEFKIGGALSKDPGLGGSVFSLGPRVLLPIEQAQKTGLVQMGSRVYFT